MILMTALVSLIYLYIYITETDRESNENERHDLLLFNSFSKTDRFFALSGFGRAVVLTLTLTLIVSFVIFKI